MTMAIEKKIIQLSEVMRIVEIVLSVNFKHKFKKGECFYTPTLQAHKFCFVIFEDVEIKIHFEHDSKSDRFMFEVYSGGDCSAMSESDFSKSNGSIILIKVGKFLTDVLKQKFISNI